MSLAVAERDVQGEELLPVGGLIVGTPRVATAIRAEAAVVVGAGRRAGPGLFVAWDPMGGHTRIELKLVLFLAPGRNPRVLHASFNLSPFNP